MPDYVPVPLQIQPTFTPETDNTSLAVDGFIAMDKIQIVDGKPQTLAGWVSVPFLDGDTPSGVCRTLYSQLLVSTSWLMIGTHSHLYAETGTQLTNITPLVTATTNLGNNPITTYFPTLANNPFTMVNGSKDVVVAHTTNPVLVAGDYMTLAGVSGAVNGVPDTELNAVHQVRSVNAGVSVTIRVTTPATSSASGGGASVTLASGLITVADTAHAIANGDRVALASATNVGGIVAATHINIEHTIRNAATNSYDIMTSGVSSSAATGGGTAPVTRRKQIAAGEQDASAGVGFGAGQYSTGAYSSALVSASLNVQPRIWSFDAYGDNIIMTPGEQTGVYEWDGDTSAAPVPVTNAPTAVNVIAVDREFIITLGAGGVPNRVYTSDRGARTVWTGTSQNEVYDRTVSGAGRFLAIATGVLGTNLLFTKNEIYTMNYRGKPAVWDIKPASRVTGIIAQNARVVVDGVCYFMGRHNLFVVGNNGIPQALLTEKVRRYIFDNINREQAAKYFVTYRPNYSEVVFRWASASATEVDSYLRYNIITGAIAAGTKARTAEESPFVLGNNPRMMDVNGVLYQHEYGVNDDASGMDWHLETNYGFASGKNVVSYHGVIPDSIQSGDIDFYCTIKDYPQSAATRVSAAQTLSPTTEQVFYDETIMRGKLRKYRWEGTALNGSWRMGVWHELARESTRRV